MFGLPLPALLLTYLPSIVCACMRSGPAATRCGSGCWSSRPASGRSIYVIAELVLEWFGGRTANRVRSGLDKALRLDREYRAAKIGAGRNADRRQRPASRATRRWRWNKYDEAEAAFRERRDGPARPTIPPVSRLTRRRLLALKRWDEAL